MILDIVKLILQYGEKLVSGAKGLARSSKTGYSASDLVILDEFYRAFDRPAFAQPFSHEVPGELLRAIDDTILALNTGLRRTRDGQIISEGKGKSELADPSLRACFDAVVTLLLEFRFSFDQAVVAQEITFFQNYVVAKSPQTNKFFDDLRNTILDIVNPIFEKIGKTAFPHILTDSHFGSVCLGVSQLPESARRFYIDVLGRKPPMFPQKVFRIETTVSGTPLAHSKSNLDVLEEVQKLHDKGIISDEDFEMARQKLK